MSIERWLDARVGDTVMSPDQEDIRVNCPFCAHRHGTPDAKHHLYVSIVKPVAHCFRCAWKGHWMTLIISVEGCSYAEAMQFIETPPPDITRFDRLHSPRGLVQTDDAIEEPDGFNYFPSAKIKIGPQECNAAYKYAVRRLRGIPMGKRRDVILGNFGWIPGTNRLWMRVDDSWWQGRSFIKAKPKYLNPPWPIGDSLWNGWALARQVPEVIVCEGVFSAIHAGPNALAICSKTITKAQATRIVRSPRLQKITVMLDADAGSDAFQLAEELEFAGFKGRIEVHTLFKGDPCDGMAGRTEVYSFQSRVEAILRDV